MIRVLLYLMVVAMLAGGAVWLADRPGEVTITWQSLHIEMSVMVLVIGIVAIAASAVLLWTVLRAIVRAPDVLWLYLRTRRGVRGYLAVSQGLIAVGSGDVRTARKLADEAARIAPDEPLTLLLTAQASQLAGDREAAERAFHAMAGRDDTRLLGLHGLFIEAQRRSDAAAARLYAEEAAANARTPAWAALAVFDARCAAGDWVGALARLDRNMKAGLIDRSAYRRLRAVLLTARAIEAHRQDDRTAARTLALEAVRFAPTLVPAAALAGRLLGEGGDMRRGARIIEAAWKANPHPDLAEAYAHLQPGDSARDRLTRVESLAETTPGHSEGALAVARAALDAQELAVARRALAPLSVAPSQRVSMLMAELEEREHDEGRAREWIARAVRARHDPAWIADGMVSDRWMPVSPVSGRLDAFQWKDPSAGLDGGDDTIIEHDRGEANAPRVPAARPSRPEIKPVQPGHLPAARHSRELAGAADAAAAPIAPIVPLVHLPDDPGPDAPPGLDAEVEASREPSAESWRRLRGLFKLP